MALRQLKSNLIVNEGNISFIEVQESPRGTYALIIYFMEGHINRKVVGDLTEDRLDKMLRGLHVLAS